MRSRAKPSDPVRDAAEVERLFAAALAEPTAARPSFLGSACPDRAVRAEVESLLDADACAGDFLDVPAAQSQPSRSIGPYRVLEQLGEGGAGVVYRAVRDTPYRQEVAMKLLRPGADSRLLLSRFRRERQILASLNHPHIARLIDAGITADRQPYLVMEYVAGRPLDVYCEAEGLSIAARLSIFVTVCRAVDFAHKNLVVHRDLKPSNVLVDDAGIPRLLDFGIARLLAPGAEGADATGPLGSAMTLHYASPEQLRGRPVTTASDVYSLGVILYKLLSGRRPYELDGLSLAEVDRVVCCVPPPPPSARLRAPSRPALCRDLNEIVLMALRKEPCARYGSAKELADDIARFCERRPVLARRATRGYRAWSFVRRHRGAVSAALFLLASVAAGAGLTLWQWRATVRERALAVASEARADETLSFLIDMFKANGVDGTRVTARDLLDRGAARLRATPPGNAVALEDALGRVYENLGLFPEAVALLEDAAATRERDGDEPAPLAASLVALAKAQFDLGRPQAAAPLLERALALREGEARAAPNGVAEALGLLADVEAFLDRRAASERDARRAIAIAEAQPVRDDARLAASLETLTRVLWASGRYAEAEPAVSEAIAIRRRSAETDPKSLADALDLACLLRLDQGDPWGAERALEEAIEHAERAVGPSHPDVVDLRSVRVAIWTDEGRYADAEALARQSLAARRSIHGEAHPAVDNALMLLAGVLYERDALGEAEVLATRALEMRARAYGRLHRSVGHSQVLLGQLLLARGDARAAEERFVEALDILRRTTGERHPALTRALVGLARARKATGRATEARAAAEEALSIARSTLRPGHPKVADALEALGEIDLAARPERAAAALGEALVIRRAVYPETHPRCARAESLLGAALAGARHPEALALLQRGFDGLRLSLGDAHPDTREAWERLSRALSP